MKKLDRDCDKCKSDDVWFCENRVIYGRNFGEWPYVFFCRNCGATVGCHKYTEDPMGTMADSQTRKLRQQAHGEFDPIWKDGWLDRSRAYGRLSELMTIPAQDCHFSHMGPRQLRQALFWIEELKAEIVKDPNLNGR